MIGKAKLLPSPQKKTLAGIALLLDRRVRESADHRGLDLPDLARVLADRAIRGELALARDDQQRLAIPGRAIFVFDVDLLLGLDLGLEVGEMDDRVRMLPAEPKGNLSFATASSFGISAGIGSVLRRRNVTPRAANIFSGG